MKKRLYLLMLSSLLITGCNQNDKNNIEYQNNIEVIYDYSEASIDSKKNNNYSSVKNNIIIDKNEKLDDLAINPTFKNEQEVITYFKNLKIKIDNLIVDNKIGEKLDSYIMTFVNFMTNKEQIGGYYFNDLTEEAKLTIKNTYVDIDNMIEKYNPNYKEELKEKSVEFKEYYLYNYEIIKEQLETWNEEGTLKENLQEEIFGRLDEDVEQMEETFKDVYGKVKEKVKK